MNAFRVLIGPSVEFEHLGGRVGRHKRNVVSLHQLEFRFFENPTVLDRSYPSGRGATSTLLCLTMCGDAHTRLLCLGYNKSDFIRRVGIRLSIDHNLDDVSTVVDILADGFSELVAGIREKVLGVFEHLLAYLPPKLPTERSDDPTGGYHCRSDNQTIANGTPHVHIGI